MGRAALLSCLLHALVVILAWLGLPSLKQKEPEPPRPIPIEIITVAEETQAPKPLPVPKPEPPKPVEKKPEPEVKPTPPEPKPTPPEPTPLPDSKPTPPEPEPIPEPTPLPAPKPPKPEPEPKPSPPKPKAPEKPKEKKKDPPKKQDSFDSILKNLEKMDEKSSEETDKLKAKSDSKAAQQVGKEADTLTISEMDKLRSHFKNCWSMPAGAQDAESLSVQIRIWANPDGMVKDAQVVDKGRMSADRYYRIAAEAALRAARDPQCAKLPLSLDKYELWKVMTLNFDPRFLLGG